MQEEQLHQAVSEYYGETIKQTADLQFSACVVNTNRSPHHAELLKKVSPKVLQTFYGCGSPIPEPLEGCTILDLGSGSGRDCFVLSGLAGKNGKVIGVDMTQAQIDIANEAIPYHKEHIPDGSPIEFRHGFIEDLHSANIQDNSIDIVISNCVINLSYDKIAVFKEIFRVLKDDGEVHISDIFTDRPLPQKAKEDKVLVGECIGNALDLKTFVDIIKSAGFVDLRAVEARVVQVPQLPADVMEPGTIVYSITFSAFKNIGKAEWNNDVAVYNGGVGGYDESYELDLNHTFPKNTPVPILSDIANILKSSRYQKYFTLKKDESASKPETPKDFVSTIQAKTVKSPSSCCCCCCGNGGCC